MITEKELIEDISKLKEKVWLHTNPMVKGISDSKLWNNVLAKLEEISSMIGQK
jgi:hypothetical protein